MADVSDRTAARQCRHARSRRRLKGTAARPRLAVFKSSKHMYAQLIDDEAGLSMGGTSTLSTGLRDRIKGMKGVAAAQEVGKEIARIATDRSVSEVVFDRGGFPYTGRIKALADSARESGLKF